jgi:hypothetical protein
LPEVVKLTIEEFGRDFFDTNLLLRDADGVVTIILRKEVDFDQCSRLSKALQERLGNYAAKSPIAKPDDLFDPSLNDMEGDKWELVQFDDNAYVYIRYLERRIVGNDWVRGIQSPILNTPPVVVFSSLKGGVGRSTALSIAAMDLCNRGKSVLAIDLDLEAPGIGGMFLSEATLPKYGALDFYVEYGRTELTQEFLEGMCGVTSFNESGGKLTIVPAAGKSSQNSPQNVLGKISRAYLEMVNQDGVPDSFLDKTRALISSLCSIQEFDVVFIDARAGLNETTAATIQGLGADVLFFGVDTPQTWEGYKYFFSHLARYKMQAKTDYDWRFKIKVIHAKALDDNEALMRFRDESFELFASYLYDELAGDETAEGLPDAFSFDLDDPTAPHFAWPIYMSSDFYEFKPLENHGQTDRQIIEPIFGVFLSNLNDRLSIE